MTSEDREYLKTLLERGLIQSPCLEMGVGLEGTDCKPLIESHGITYMGTDIVEGSAVDFVIDFEQPLESIKEKISSVGEFGSVLIFNVLEHTFDPVKILDNIMGILKPGGTCAVLTPTVWPLHGFPIDTWRILPEWYVEYAKRRGYTLVDDALEYVGKGKVKDFVGADGKWMFPKPGRSNLHYQYSRVIHKLFNTYGRANFFPSHIATAAVIKKS